MNIRVLVFLLPIVASLFVVGIPAAKTSPSISLYPSTTINYGQPFFISATNGQSGNYIEVGMQVSASVFTTIAFAVVTTYNFSEAGGYYAAGSYTWNVIDKASIGGAEIGSTTNVLTINKIPPLIVLYTPSNMVYSGGGGNITASIVTIGQQVPLNVFVNGVLTKTTYNSVIFSTSAAPGLYNIVANTLATTNYTALSYSANFVIAPVASAYPTTNDLAWTASNTLTNIGVQSIAGSGGFTCAPAGGVGDTCTGVVTGYSPIYSGNFPVSINSANLISWSPSAFTYNTPISLLGTYNTLSCIGCSNYNAMYLNSIIGVNGIAATTIGQAVTIGTALGGTNLRILNGNLVSTSISQSQSWVGQFNGINSNVVTPLTIGGSQLSFSVWADTLSAGRIPIAQGRSWIDVCDLGYSTFEIANTLGKQTVVNGNPCPAFGSWHYYVGTYNGVAESIYEDGQFVNSISKVGNVAVVNVITIGMAANLQDPFNGFIADAQVYNAVLTQNQITQLYQEGIGGVPVNNQIVGWYPLDNNATDYTGTNPGTAYNVLWAVGPPGTIYNTQNALQVNSYNLTVITGNGLTTTGNILNVSIVAGGNLLFSNKALDTYATSYNSQYINSIVGINGVISSTVGQTVTLAVNAGYTITNTMGQVNCNCITSVAAYNSAGVINTFTGALGFTEPYVNQPEPGINEIELGINKPLGLSSNNLYLTLFFNTLLQQNDSNGFLTVNTPYLAHNGLLATSANYLVVNAIAPITNTIGVGCLGCSNYNSVYINSVSGVNGVLTTQTGQSVTLAVNTLLPITNTLGEIGLAYTGNLFTTGGSLNSQYSTYNSMYLTGITGVNGILVSTSGQTVTLAVNVIAPITNTLNEIGCSGCTSYNALYIETISGVNGILTSISGQTVTLAVNVLSPTTNSFGYVSCANCGNYNSLYWTGSNYNSVYIDSISGVNGILKTQAGQAITLAVNTIGPVTNTLGEIGLSYAGNVFYNGNNLDSNAIPGPQGPQGNQGNTGAQGVNGIPGYTPVFSAIYPLSLSPSNVFSLVANGIFNFNSPLSLLGTPNTLSVLYGGNVFLSGTHIDSLNSGGGGGGGYYPVYTATGPLSISPLNVITLKYNATLTLDNIGYLGVNVFPTGNVFFSKNSLDALNTGGSGYTGNFPIVISGGVISLYPGDLNPFAALSFIILGGGFLFLEREKWLLGMRVQGAGVMLFLLMILLAALYAGL